MHRKIPEKKLRHKIPRDVRERIGVETSLLNCNGDKIKTGDDVHLKGTDYKGKVMWNRHQDCFGIFMGLWYLDMDPLNPDCYGKFIRIPDDNGMRMEIEPV